jgi:hypothetical protein
VTLDANNLPTDPDALRALLIAERCFGYSAPSIVMPARRFQSLGARSGSEVIFDNVRAHYQHGSSYRVVPKIGIR